MPQSASSDRRFAKQVFSFPPCGESGRPWNMRFLALGLLSLALPASLPSLAAGQVPETTRDENRAVAVASQDGGLRCLLDAQSGLPLQVQSAAAKRSWLSAPVSVKVRNEASGKQAALVRGKARQSADAIAVEGNLDALGLTVSQKWSAAPNGLAWDLLFRGDGPRARE